MLRSTTILTAAATLLGGMLLAPTTRAQPSICEDDGLIIFEIENTPPNGSWVPETSEPGFKGSSYYRWTGANHFNNPGVAPLLYTFEVTDPGMYQLRIRNLHTHPDITLENDCWTRFDGGPWEKTFSNINLVWTFSTWFEGTNDRAEHFLSAGTHTFEISARSANFRIDRVHLYKSEGPAPVNENATFPETICPETWIDLGNGLAGTGGQTPVLTGEGDLTDDALTTLTLSNALPNADVYVVIGFSEINANFKFGVMVPNVDLIVGPVPADGSGVLALSANWPVGTPSGFSVWWQEWVQDAGGPAGFAASNGLLSVVP